MGVILAAASLYGMAVKLGAPWSLHTCLALVNSLTHADLQACARIPTHYCQVCQLCGCISTCAAPSWLQVCLAAHKTCMAGRHFQRLSKFGDAVGRPLSDTTSVSRDPVHIEDPKKVHVEVPVQAPQQVCDVARGDAKRLARGSAPGAAQMYPPRAVCCRVKPTSGRRHKKSTAVPVALA